MKKLIHIALGLALVFGMSSCEDYLDVNTDPDNPVSETVSPQLRLPWIQNYYAYAWGTASMRTNTIAGIMTQTGGTAANSLLSSWNPAQSSCTTIYQNFYLGAGVNIEALIDKAEAEGAYHYEGAAYCIKAMGFMMMLDLHGELPVQEAFIGKTDPAYDDGMANSGRNTTDMYYYTDAKYDYVGGTGTFYARPNSDTDILTYSEMCFIKAEVLFRKGDTDGALSAYKKGIEANFDRMQEKLKSWEAEGTQNEDQKPMADNAKSSYMASNAVCQNAANLTLFEIMRQKIIALGINIENWNDMRRLDYDYVDYDRPNDFSAVSKIIGTSKDDPTYWFRRFSQSTHESNYNLTQLKASNKQAMTDPIWSCPGWWDCATDNEYYGYIK